METSLQEQAVTIVIRGNFNPAIFHPRWFASNELIRQEEEESASDIDIITSQLQLARFSTNWFGLLVTQDRFAIETKDSSKYAPLRDLATGTFGILEHTPIRTYGLNCKRVYFMPDEAAWHKVGDHFAPKQSWDKVMKSPGLLSIVLQEREGHEERGKLQITLEAMPRPHDSEKYGVVIRINEHYDIPNKDSEQPDNIKHLLTTLQLRWLDFLKYSQETSDSLLQDPFN